MSNFNENSTAEDIVYKLDEYLPMLDEDRQFIKKYRSDFIYHFRSNFYNLALFSFHYLYMFILSTSMVKYCAFNKNDIIHKSGNQKDLQIELFSYFGKASEKNIFKSIKDKSLKKDIVSAHASNVCLRDSIAHSSGRNVLKNELLNYLNNCFIVLEFFQPTSLESCICRNDINVKWENADNDLLDAMCNGDKATVDDIVIGFLIDYHLSYKDFLYLPHISSKLNAFSYLSRYVELYDGELSISDNIKIDAYNILSNDEIKSEILALDYTPDKNVAQNVMTKIYTESEYWIPVGSEKLKMSDKELIKYGIKNVQCEKLEGV